MVGGAVTAVVVAVAVGEEKWLSSKGMKAEVELDDDVRCCCCCWSMAAAAAAMR